jgi:hypothetical protein
MVERYTKKQVVLLYMVKNIKPCQYFIKMIVLRGIYGSKVACFTHGMGSIRTAGYDFIKNVGGEKT